MRKNKALYTNLLLLLTAMIWGFAFVAQRMGMDHLGPYTFNALRFALGGISLFPLFWYVQRGQRKQAALSRTPRPPDTWQARYGGLLLGLVLFSGASLQQVGLLYTTAGKAGFITGLYVVFVALLGLIWKQQLKMTLWWGVLLATLGMYLLSMTANFSIAFGDVIVLVGAVFWAVHVQLTGYLSPRTHVLKLALQQSFVCAFLSMIVALIRESITFTGILGATFPLLYGGIMSVGIAYTLQVYVQKTANPTYAAIILSLEAVFAALGGWLVLNETLSIRALIGCGLMLAGMMAAQLDSLNLKKLWNRNK